MNLKPFDLQRAIAGDKVVTRDGREYKFAGYNPDASELVRVLGWVGEKELCSFANGRLWQDKDSPDDLFMAPTVKEWWGVMFKDKDGRWVTWGSYSSKEDAIQNIADRTVFSMEEASTAEPFLIKREEE